MNNVNLYIPHVFANISKEEVTNVFESLRIGKVSNIDFVNKMADQSQYNAVYIHFEYWYDNTSARNFQERVLNPAKEARIVYDDPWYWIVLENKAKKHVSGDRKPRIVLDLEEEEVAAPTKQMMTNKDFSELLKAPVKKLPIAPGLQLPIAPGLQLSIAPGLQLSIAPGLPEVMDDDAMMDDLEALMWKEECEHLITIDGRYVRELENENKELKNINQELNRQLSFYYKDSLTQFSERL